MTQPERASRGTLPARGGLLPEVSIRLPQLTQEAVTNPV